MKPALCLAVLVSLPLMLGAAPNDLLAYETPVVHVAPPAPSGNGGQDGSPAHPYRDLQTAIDAAPSGALLDLAPGDYHANPHAYAEPTCANCQEANTSVAASTGFVVRGKSLTIQGPVDRSARLHTHAGYGVYIEDAPEVLLVGLTILDGKRDKDGQASDGAVVAKSARVEITNCTLGPNPVPAPLLKEVIVGICGAVGREEATLVIHDTLIQDNSWDGVAFYRGATGTLTDLVIANGRGAGIGITWDSAVRATRCQVSGYWKGIGTFGTSQAEIQNCLIHDLRGWGLIASGESTLTATNNTVVRCGNVGIALWNPEATLSLTNNISWGNGTVPQWVAPPVGLWWNGDRAALDVRYNLFGNNTAGDFLYGYEDTEDASWSLAGANMNRSGHPLYRTAGDYRQVLASSPIIDGGDPTIRDRDGSVSDLGWTGGPEGV